ncbi:MAG: hypothetical protein O3A65_06850 [Proteobacteria bacterium]|nr:hypothetical protein [Pseudomonadota bacterium]
MLNSTLIFSGVILSFTISLVVAPSSVNAQPIHTNSEASAQLISEAVDLVLTSDDDQVQFFGNYRAYESQQLSSWLSVNELVLTIGGWKAYARDIYRYQTSEGRSK